MQKLLFMLFLFGFTLASANGTVLEGRIVSNGKAMPKVSVSSSNTQSVSNRRGNFRLRNLLANDTLTVKTPTDTLRIALNDANRVLIEFSADSVLIHLETIKQAAASFGGIMLTRQALERADAHNLLKAIALSTAGVEYSGDNLIIRGQQTLGQHPNPLYIINGVQTWSASHISVPEVESVEVLRGPEAAFFGVKGSGGVVIINTR